ncbi:Xaa-Pro peptidase family protein [Deferribacter thermophilus]|uniref:M24 family metallopeptidase n=1 Tax=Deferribacter thermophilus TaxID=53573 RepID=UPI003C2592C2
MRKNRILKLRGYLEREGYFPYFISDLSNIYYLSGFTGSTAYLIITENENIFVTDFRYDLQSKKEVSKDFNIVVGNNYNEMFKKLLSDFDKVFIEPSGDLTTFISLQNLNKEVLVASNDYVKELRMIKDQDEILAIKEAYLIAEESFLGVLKSGFFNKTEREVAGYLEYLMKINGSRKPSFDSIIASGFRGALPHGVASEKIINENEPVIVDFGCKIQYCSDITRVIYNGDDKHILNIIEIVKSALMYAKEAVKPGVKCKEVDKVARDYIASKGFGDFFNHGLGHGVGIDVHEKPSFNPRDETVLQEGMVMTIEPGIYFENEFGVRLEDTVLVTKDGCITLNEKLKDYVYKIQN